MDEIVLSSGSDSDSDIEIIFSKPSQDIIIIESSSKRRCLEFSKPPVPVEKVQEIFIEDLAQKKSDDSEKILVHEVRPKIMEVSSIKLMPKNDKPIQEYLISLLNKSYIIKNLKYVEDMDMSFSDELFSKFTCWESSKNTHFFTLFLSWIKIAKSKTIDLCELLNFLEKFMNFGASLDQKSAEIDFISEFLIKFSQCVHLISVKIDDCDQEKGLGQKKLSKLHSTKMHLHDFITKLLKLHRRTNFKMFLTFFKIIFDIYRVYLLFLFRVKQKQKNNPFNLIKFFKPDEKFIYSLLDHFSSSVSLFQKNIEFFRSIQFTTFGQIIQSIVLANLLFYEKELIKRHTNEIFNKLEDIYSKLNSIETKSVFRNQFLSLDEIKIKFFHQKLSQLLSDKHQLNDLDEYLNLLEEYLAVFSRLEPNIENNSFVAILFDIDDSLSNKQRIIELFYEVNFLKDLDEKSTLHIKNLIAHFF
ncbi:hypothetical protein BpHYR1_027962 [Brachionus plicatilis]|uniref:Uncharacterized protein n=1 Tax=Brachionus plicatilis TaxID=10195 RepID=A0A3M7QTT0_BRAPC|nr:hypothetical protein BpHYR1_027962 [Brachionus plicatilis]